VQPSPGALDFSSIDNLLAVVAKHNETFADTTRVVLTVGARNFLYPELHQPKWAGPREQPFIGNQQSASEYRKYFETSITRYRDSPLLYAWQVENEPFDYVGNVQTGDDRISASQLTWEIDLVHELDPAHKAAVTTYNGWNLTVDMLQLYATPVLARLGGYPSGHPEEALQAGDALGLDLYIVDFWVRRAHGMGKDIWLAEVQAEPWGAATESFTPTDLLESAIDYRDEPLDVVLMWGAETWLQDPEWLATATHAMDLLRSP
jgi:hypothetical protein